MGTRELSDDEIAQLFAAVKPIFDRNGGDPKATKAELQEAFAAKPCKAAVQDVFYHAVDVLVQLQTEKQKGAATHDRD